MLRNLQISHRDKRSDLIDVKEHGDLSDDMGDENGTQGLISSCRPLSEHRYARNEAVSCNGLQQLRRTYHSHKR